MPAGADAGGKAIPPAARWHAHLAPAKPAAPGAERARRFEVPRLVPHPRQLRRQKARAARDLRRAGKPSPGAYDSRAPDRQASRAFSPTPRAALFNALNQPGLSAGTGSPPDPTGAIGPSGYIEMVNKQIGLYDRTNLILLTSATLPDSRRFTVDTKPPQTKIGSGPRGTTAKQTAKFRFRSSEAGSTFKCKLDRKPFKPCRSPKTYERLKPGKHRFKVRATDRVGYRDRTPAKRSWRITP
jgi:hypothetical protein